MPLPEDTKAANRCPGRNLLRKEVGSNSKPSPKPKDRHANRSNRPERGVAQERKWEFRFAVQSQEADAALDTALDIIMRYAEERNYFDSS